MMHPPMDHDKSQNSITNPVKRDNSPISSSSSPAHIPVNSILRVTTMYGAERIGKVAAYDSSFNLVTLHLKGSKPGLTSVAVINLNHCREYNVEQEPKDDVLEPLYPIDINKLKKRQVENEAEKKKEASFVNIKASRIGQALFRDLKKTMNQVIRWSKNDILINNNVRIVEPYRAENVSIDSPPQSNNAITNKNSAKGDNDTKTHIIKLVEKFWSDQTKLPSNTDSTRNKTNETTDSASSVS